MLKEVQIQEIQSEVAGLLASPLHTTLCLIRDSRRTKNHMCCTTLGSEPRRAAGGTESHTPGQNTAP